jgi:type VI secretion system secreted protein VgrG
LDIRALAEVFDGWSETMRPIRLRLSHGKRVLDNALMIKRVTGTETVCGGLDYRLLCVSMHADLQLKEFIALPAEVQFVTDRGDLHAICGIVAQAAAGQSDGGFATYELVMRDALALLEHRINTRIFRNMNELEITEVILNEWRHTNPVLAETFDVDWSCVTGEYPKREFTMQHNESDADFLRRLWRRRGIAWCIRSGPASQRQLRVSPTHALVLFDDAYLLPQNIAGTVRYHRDDGTEKQDTITAWSPVRRLKPGKVTRHSWDYKEGRPMTSYSSSCIDQGEVGTQFAASLDDYLVDVPHAGDDGRDYLKLGDLRMKRHEYESKCFHGEGSVRTLCVGQWIALSGHYEIDTHPAKEREFVVTRLEVDAENNLPKTVDDRVKRLFALNRWDDGPSCRQSGRQSWRRGYRGIGECSRRIGTIAERVLWQWLVACDA